MRDKTDQEKKGPRPMPGGTLESDTRHLVLRGDPRKMDTIPDRSVHLVLTCPPGWTPGSERLAPERLPLPYRQYLTELESILHQIVRVLIPGGRLIWVARDIWLSRRQHGRHQVIAFPADLAMICREAGLEHLTPILWHQQRPPRRSPAFLGKPYEPNGGIPPDTAVILMQRKPGGFRTPSAQQRRMSRIDKGLYRQWFRQVWDLEPEEDDDGPYPLWAAERLIRMFSFWKDTVLDPFCGAGTTLVAALRCGRNGVGIEADSDVCRMAVNRIHEASSPLFNRIRLGCRNLNDIDPEEFAALGQSVSCAGHGDPEPN